MLIPKLSLEQISHQRTVRRAADERGSTLIQFSSDPRLSAFIRGSFVHANENHYSCPAKRLTPRKTAKVCFAPWREAYFSQNSRYLWATQSIVASTHQSIDCSAHKRCLAMPHHRQQASVDTDARRKPGKPPCADERACDARAVSRAHDAALRCLPARQRCASQVQARLAPVAFLQNPRPGCRLAMNMADSVSSSRLDWQPQRKPCSPAHGSG